MTNSSTTVAELRLRGSTGTVGAQLHWPVGGSVAAKLLVFFPARTPADAAFLDRLCRRSGLMVLVALCRTASDAVSTVEWAADHAAELGAAGSSIAVAGDGRGNDLAAAVARHAARGGWPVVHPLVLIATRTPRQRADVSGAHLLDRRAGGDVVTDLITLMEGTNR